jgi:hypothetical protein
MESKDVRALMEAARTGTPSVNSGFTALATPEIVAGLCQDWLLMRETLKDVGSAAVELEMPYKDRIDYINSLVRTALAAL